MNDDNLPALAPEKYHANERSEEVRDIIERMPVNWGLKVSMIVLFIFCGLLFTGWRIRYPDIVTGYVTINTSLAPVKLVAAVSGTLKLNCDSSQVHVNSGEVVAYIESATSYDTLQVIKRVLKKYNPSLIKNTSILAQLPREIALGELTSKYYNFLSSLHQMANFVNDKLFEKQLRSLQELRSYQIDEVNSSSDRIEISENSLEFSKKLFTRDSTLFSKRVVSEAELERSKLNYFSSKANYSNARSTKIGAEKQAQQTLSQISEVNIQRDEKRKELEIFVLSSYNDLIDNIRLWEQRYLFRAPYEGRIQYLRFWSNGQFVQANEPVFTIVPALKEPYGQVSLPSVGAGKVKIGQEVIVKLDDFPYREYGSVTGLVSGISLTTNTERTAQGNVETYLVTVKFPNGLMTNYGKPITFRHEAKGTAEIITEDRQLFERLFDNLKYVLNK